jgi:hypothetical protein
LTMLRGSALAIFTVSRLVRMSWPVRQWRNTDDGSTGGASGTRWRRCQRRARRESFNKLTAGPQGRLFNMLEDGT